MVKSREMKIETNEDGYVHVQLYDKITKSNHINDKIMLRLVLIHTQESTLHCSPPHQRPGEWRKDGEPEMMRHSQIKCSICNWCKKVLFVEHVTGRQLNSFISKTVRGHLFSMRRLADIMENIISRVDRVKLNGHSPFWSPPQPTVLLFSIFFPFIVFYLNYYSKFVDYSQF